MPEKNRRKFVIAGILLGLFLSALESTVVATAMPSVVASLGGLSIYSWVFSGYLLSSTITMPLWGRLSDLHGRRNLFLIGVSIFMFGSMLCGISRSMHQLILFRFIQGLGAGAVMPLTFTIIGDLFDLEQRAKMQGLFSGVWGVASIVGPLLGGYLTDHVSWRWVFYINVPFGFISMFLIYYGLLEGDHKGMDGALDIVGTLTFTGAVLSLLIGLSVFSHHPVAGIILFLSCAVLLLLYVRTENRAEHPLIPLKLFKIRIFSAAQIAGIFCGMAMFGTISFIPLYMQSVLGSTATGAGSILLPFMLGWVTFSILGGRLILRVGYKKVIVTGNILLLFGFMLMVMLGERSSVAHVMVCMALAGAGMGFNFAPFMIAVQNSVPRELMGAVTSSTQFVRSIGGAIGVAILGAVLSHHLKTTSYALVQDPSAANQIIGRILEHPDSIVSPESRLNIPPEILRQVRSHMAFGLKKVFGVGLVFAIFAFFASFTVPGGPARAQVKEPQSL